VRPTTDFAKESLFNILNNRVDYEEISVLELFAGTGSISFEFASRGAKEITAIDVNNRCNEFIRRAAVTYNFPNIRTVRADVFAFLGFCKAKYNVIFADPPYDMKDIEKLPDLVMNNKLLLEDGIFILEHSKTHDFSKHPSFLEHRKYGKVNFSFFGNNDM
ncbi:MAG: methyltransferase domain-containing protein, partial [Bacteroidetes bacterium]|nr:methyltransferase domain-containing protein [Bacteroidota bacterium]